ncbi:MAG: hypothetical protein JWO62_2292 [Acidimicrobiaceae bacterium]|nr:hypothetical protein [Acidimicrobiaceae bacterium]
MGTRERRDTTGRRAVATAEPDAPPLPRATPATRIQPATPSATITAEMPIVRPPQGRHPRPPAGRRTEERYESRRRPAPYAVRLTVWLLFFVLVLMLAGRAVEHYHPTWLDFLRNSATTSSAPAGQGGAPSTTSAPVTTRQASGFRETSHTSTGATYAVPSRSYSIVVVTAHPCWTAINVPAGSKTLQYGQTVQPSASPKAFPVTGSSTITVSATATSIAVETGGTTIGTIKAPQLNYGYTFVPAGT